MSVGSFFITIGADGTISCPLLLKKSKNRCLISAEVIVFSVQAKQRCDLPKAFKNYVLLIKITFEPQKLRASKVRIAVLKKIRQSNCYMAKPVTSSGAATRGHYDQQAGCLRRALTARKTDITR